MELWKRTETVGCEMEDGSDTRTSSVRFIIVYDEEKEKFSEHMADDYSGTDYSYQVNYRKILDLEDDDVSEIRKAIQIYFDKKLKEEIVDNLQ